MIVLIKPLPRFLIARRPNLIAPFLTVEYNEVTELSETVRGEGGFGSTGQK